MLQRKDQSISFLFLLHDIYIYRKDSQDRLLSLLAQFLQTKSTEDYESPDFIEALNGVINLDSHKFAPILLQFPESVVWICA